MDRPSTPGSSWALILTLTFNRTESLNCSYHVLIGVWG